MGPSGLFYRVVLPYSPSLLAYFTSRTHLRIPDEGLSLSIFCHLVCHFRWKLLAPLNRSHGMIRPKSQTLKFYRKSHEMERRTNERTESKTVERIPLFSRPRAQSRPDMPPPMMATRGSSETGALKMSCSWEKLFLMEDLLEGFLLGFLEVLALLPAWIGFLVWLVLLCLGPGRKIGVRVFGLPLKKGSEGFRGLNGERRREETLRTPAAVCMALGVLARGRFLGRTPEGFIRFSLTNEESCCGAHRDLLAFKVWAYIFNLVNKQVFLFWAYACWAEL